MKMTRSLLQLSHFTNSQTENQFDVSAHEFSFSKDKFRIQLTVFIQNESLLSIFQYIHFSVVMHMNGWMAGGTPFFSNKY